MISSRASKIGERRPGHRRKGRTGIGIAVGEDDPVAPLFGPQHAGHDRIEPPLQERKDHAVPVLHDEFDSLARSGHKVPGPNRSQTRLGRPMHQWRSRAGRRPSVPIRRHVLRMARGSSHRCEGRSGGDAYRCVSFSFWSSLPDANRDGAMVGLIRYPPASSAYPAPNRPAPARLYPQAACSLEPAQSSSSRARSALPASTACSPEHPERPRVIRDRAHKAVRWQRRTPAWLDVVIDRPSAHRRGLWQSRHHPGPVRRPGQAHLQRGG